MANNNLIFQIIQGLLKVFCGGSAHDKPNQQQQQQQGGYNNQYPGQQYQQQQSQQQQQPYYPPQQQQGHPGPGKQNQQSWSQIAGGTSPPHQQNYNQHNNNYQNQNHAQNNKPNNNYNNQHQNNNYQKPYRPQGLPAGGIIGPHHQANHAHAQDDNQINATNERYVQLRNQARHEGDEAHKCFAQSQQAYQSGDGGRAHDLSAQGKQHAQRQDELDDEASDWIFKANNEDSPPGTIDLHGLYVKEAIERTERAVTEGQQKGDREMRVIVGKGIHSQGHVPKIKPAVEDLMRKYNLSAHVDPHNTGVLIVDLTGSTQGSRTRDAGGLVDQMEKDEGEGCIIM